MDNVTLEVTGIVEVPRLVLKFSTTLPEKGVAFRDYDKLDADLKALVDKTVPDMNANGKPKAKFAKEYIVQFEDVDSGRKYLYDVKVRTFADGKPWTQSKALLEKVGKAVKGKIDIGEYFPLNSLFQAKLTKAEDAKFWRINADTLVRV